MLAPPDRAGESYVVFGKADGIPVDLSDIAAGRGGFVINGIPTGACARDHAGLVVLLVAPRHPRPQWRPSAATVSASTR